MTAHEIASPRRPGSRPLRVHPTDGSAPRLRAAVLGRGLVLALGLIAGLMAIGASPLRADEFDDLRQQMAQLKQQMTLLQNQVPGAGAGGTGGAAGDGTIAAQQVVQMQQFSQQMSQLQGQIEQLGIKVDDLADKFARMQKDTEFRLGRLEQAGGTGLAAPTGGVMAPAAGAPAAMAAPAATGPLPLPQSAGDASVDNSAGAPQPLGAPDNQAPVGSEANPAPAPAAPGTLGTLTAAQAANLPQPPAGAAEAAAAAAAAQTPVPAPAAQDPNSIVLPGNTPQEQYDYATGLLQRGAYAEAELALKAFVTQHAKDPLAGNAQYWLGESYYVRSDFKNAAAAFAEGYQKYPKSPKAPDNLLKLGMSLGQTGAKDNACLAFKQLAKQFPSASAAIKDRSARAQQRYGCPTS